MQRHLSGHDALAIAGLGGKLGRPLRTLFIVHRPGNDLAAVDIDDEVQVIEHAAHRSTQVGDIPAPYLVRPARHPGHRLVAPRQRTALAVGELTFGPQQPVQGRFRSHVAARIGQQRHHLMRTLVPIGRGAQHRQRRSTLDVAELIGRPGPGPTSLVLEALCVPALHGA